MRQLQLTPPLKFNKLLQFYSLKFEALPSADVLHSAQIPKIYVYTNKFALYKFCYIIKATKYRDHLMKSSTVRKLSVKLTEKIVSSRGNSFVFRFLHIYNLTHTLRIYLKKIKIFSEFFQTIILSMRKKVSFLVPLNK